MAQRYFVPDLPAPGPAELTGELAHHLGRVLRVQAGEPLLLADGRGHTAAATVTATAKQSIRVQVEAARYEPPPGRRVHVAFAPPRLQRAEWLFEHGTEVGIDAFHPLWTQRSRPQGERLDRWQRIVAAAAGQCGRAWLPEVRPARELTAWLGAGDLPAARCVGAGEAASDLASAARATTGDLLLLVGPEGGFAADERAAIAAAGFTAVRLGPFTLRTETAALVGAALLRSVDVSSRSAAGSRSTS